MRRTAHLSSSGRVPCLRPLVAVARSARLSRNVRISRTLMPYHHKAPQHERARHASRIVQGVQEAQAALAGCVALATAARRSLWRRARRRRTHARSPPPFPHNLSASLTPISVLPTYILSIKLLYDMNCSLSIV